MTDIRYFVEQQAYDDSWVRLSAGHEREAAARNQLARLRGSPSAAGFRLIRERQRAGGGYRTRTDVFEIQSTTSSEVLNA